MLERRRMSARSEVRISAEKLGESTDLDVCGLLTTSMRKMKTRASCLCLDNITLVILVRGR